MPLESAQIFFEYQNSGRGVKRALCGKECEIEHIHAKHHTKHHENKIN